MGKQPRPLPSEDNKCDYFPVRQTRSVTYKSVYTFQKVCGIKTLKSEPFCVVPLPHKFHDHRELTVTTGNIDFDVKIKNVVWLENPLKQTGK